MLLKNKILPEEMLKGVLRGRMVRFQVTFADFYNWKKSWFKNGRGQPKPYKCTTVSVYNVLQTYNVLCKGIGMDSA